MKILLSFYEEFSPNTGAHSNIIDIILSNGMKYTSANLRVTGGDCKPEKRKCGLCLQDALCLQAGEKNYCRRAASSFKSSYAA